MKAIVLAAGKGSRLGSEKLHLPKVLREVEGRTLLDYVLENISFISKGDTVIVVGYCAEQVEGRFSKEYTFVLQEHQLGTGHAVMVTRDALADYDGPVLVIYGDMPLVHQSTYSDLCKAHVASGNDCTFLTVMSDRFTSYGRIIRDQDNCIAGIVEARDCSPEQFAIREVNPGIYVFNSKPLYAALANLKAENAQQEYYLTDAPALIMQAGGKVGSLTITDDTQVLGVNTPQELELCAELVRARKGE